MAYLREELKYPGVEQAAVLEKTRSNGTSERWYLLTSLPADKLNAKAFLKAVRGHWQIENGLHHVKDRTLKEDHHRTKYPQQGQSLAILRNAVVSILNKSTPPKRRKVSRPRQALHFLTHPLRALQLLQHV